MARPGPGGQQKSPASSTGDEAPSAKAELHVLKIPDGDPSAVPELWEPDVAGKPGRLLTFWRRAGFGVHARMMVPAADAGELVAAFRSVSLAVTWALTVVITLVITVSVGMAAEVIIAITLIELVGFVIGALTARRKRRA
jgi:hypothetical protein